MAEIYIAFVDTPGFFAGIIRRVIKQKYIHVALSLDPYLEETYSIGRRHPSVPLKRLTASADVTRPCLLLQVLRRKINIKYSVHFRMPII